MTDENTVAAATDGAPAPKLENKLIQVTSPETDAAAAVEAKAAGDETAKAEAAAAEEATAKAPNVPKSMQAAYDKLAYEKRDALREAKRLAAELATRDATIEALRKGGMTKTEATAEADSKGDVVPRAELDRMVQEAAEKLAASRAEEAAKVAAQNQFNADSNASYAKGKEAFGDEFDTALKNIGMVGFNDTILGTALATDAAHKVLYELGNNPDEAARVFALTPAKMAIEFAKIANKAAPAVKVDVSKAPPPNRPLAGSARNDPAPRDDDTDADWFAKRRAEKLARARGAA